MKENVRLICIDVLEQKIQELESLGELRDGVQEYNLRNCWFALNELMQMQ